MVGLFPLWGHYEQCWNEHLCTRFCMNICFQFSWLKNILINKISSFCYAYLHLQIKTLLYIMYGSQLLTSFFLLGEIIPVGNCFQSVAKWLLLPSVERTSRVCPGNIQPCNMKNRDIYWRRCKIQETLYIGQWHLSPLQSRHLGTSHSSLSISFTVQDTMQNLLLE